MPKRKKVLSKHSKFYAIGKKGREDAVKLRAEGRSFEYIAEYLNKKYKHCLNEINPITFTNVATYFRRWANQQVAAIGEKTIDKISERIWKASKLEELLNVLYEWLLIYKLEGKKLSLTGSLVLDGFTIKPELGYVEFSSDGEFRFNRPGTSITFPLRKGKYYRVRRQPSVSVRSVQVYRI